MIFVRNSIQKAGTEVPAFCMLNCRGYYFLCFSILCSIDFTIASSILKR